jgi:hypothetical protein
MADNLYTLIRQITEANTGPNNPIPNPQELARLVVKAIPQQDYPEHLQTALAPLCATQLRSMRNNALHGAIGARRKRREGVGINDLVRDWWSELLETTLPINGSLKRMGDCTVEDLDWAIDSRQQLMNSIHTEIDYYTYLRSELKTRNVTHVRDLPGEEMMKRTA